MVRLQYPNSDVDDILRLYEQLTGKKLVKDNFVQGKVNIFISKDVPWEEAVKIIEINLLMNGFSLVPADNDIVKVIGTGKNPRTTVVPYFGYARQDRKPGPRTIKRLPSASLCAQVRLVGRRVARRRRAVRQHSVSEPARNFAAERVGWLSEPV